MTIAGRKATLLMAALIVSVCANLLLGGLMLGQEWRSGHRRSPQERALERLVETLPADAQKAVRDRFAAHGDDIGREIGELRAARKGVAQLLGRPEVSGEQLATALADLRRQSTEVQEAVHGVLVEAATQMPADVRRQWQPRWWSIR